MTDEEIKTGDRVHWYSRPKDQGTVLEVRQNNLRPYKVQWDNEEGPTHHRPESIRLVKGNK